MKLLPGENSPRRRRTPVGDTAAGTGTASHVRVERPDAGAACPPEITLIFCHVRPQRGSRWQPLRAQRGAVGERRGDGAEGPERPLLLRAVRPCAVLTRAPPRTRTRSIRVCRAVTRFHGGWRGCCAHRCRPLCTARRSWFCSFVTKFTTFLDKEGKEGQKEQTYAGTGADPRCWGGAELCRSLLLFRFLLICFLFFLLLHSSTSSSPSSSISSSSTSSPSSSSSPFSSSSCLPLCPPFSSPPPPPPLHSPTAPLPHEPPRLRRQRAVVGAAAWGQRRRQPSHVSPSVGSDGAGRSGTYILIDMVLNKMAKGESRRTAWWWLRAGGGVATATWGHAHRGLGRLRCCCPSSEPVRALGSQHGDTPASHLALAFAAGVSTRLTPGQTHSTASAPRTGSLGPGAAQLRASWPVPGEPSLSQPRWQGRPRLTHLRRLVAEPSHLGHLTSCDALHPRVHLSVRPCASHSSPGPTLGTSPGAGSSSSRGRPCASGSTETGGAARAGGAPADPMTQRLPVIPGRHRLLVTPSASPAAWDSDAEMGRPWPPLSPERSAQPGHPHLRPQRRPRPRLRLPRCAALHTPSPSGQQPPDRPFQAPFLSS